MHASWSDTNGPPTGLPGAGLCLGLGDGRPRSSDCRASALGSLVGRGDGSVGAGGEPGAVSGDGAGNPADGGGLAGSIGVGLGIGVDAGSGLAIGDGKPESMFGVSGGGSGRDIDGEALKGGTDVGIGVGAGLYVGLTIDGKDGTAGTDVGCDTAPAGDDVIGLELGVGDSGRPTLGPEGLLEATGL